MKKFFITLIPLLTGAMLSAQLPECDIWVFDFSSYNSRFTFRNGFNVTDHKGYDNQPCFSESGSYMLWTSQRDSLGTDIYRYDFSNKAIKRITQTAYSEYSPTYMDGNKYISAVVVEKDSVQRLWKYNKMTGEGTVLMPRVTQVGYHCWYDSRTVFLFKVTEPSTLEIANAASGVTKVCAGNVGRCMQVWHSPKAKLLLYEIDDGKGNFTIRALNGSGMNVADFAPVALPEGCQDFALDANDNIFAAKEAKLYQWKIGSSTEWALAADFGGNGLHSITRIAISSSGHKIALVDNN
ncbi:MAG TPA: hypothetical protein VFU15_12190 [Bacteroidia bacterium]|nr:hypothetical protein [Bacteroidia bacterium]